MSAANSGHPLRRSNVQPHLTRLQRLWAAGAALIGSGASADLHPQFRLLNKLSRSRSHDGRAGSDTYPSLSSAGIATRAVDKRGLTLDGHVPSHCAVRLLRRENPNWKYVEVRCSKYLNNIVEQDHRAIKRRCVSRSGPAAVRGTGPSSSNGSGLWRNSPRSTTGEWSISASADAPEPSYEGYFAPKAYWSPRLIPSPLLSKKLTSAFDLP